jgi:hypothetical protein
VRQCLFCDKIPKTREHVWPEWILKRIWPQAIISRFSGRQTIEIKGPRPELTTKFVCKTCNEGWMHKLETANVPLIGSMMQDLSIILDHSQQWSIAAWAVKTSMVMEVTTRRHRKGFYTEADRRNLRDTLTLPPNTFVWLGRLVGFNSVLHWGSDAWERKPPGPDMAHTYVNTLGVCCFVVQVATLHAPVEYGPINILPRPLGVKPWDDVLTRIWPPAETVQWPPPSPIADGDGPSFLDVHTRWAAEANFPE